MILLSTCPWTTTCGVSWPGSSAGAPCSRRRSSCSSKSVNARAGKSATPRFNTTTSARRGPPSRSPGLYGLVSRTGSWFASLGWAISPRPRRFPLARIAGRGHAAVCRAFARDCSKERNKQPIAVILVRSIFRSIGLRITAIGCLLRFLEAIRHGEALKLHVAAARDPRQRGKRRGQQPMAHRGEANQEPVREMSQGREQPAIVIVDPRADLVVLKHGVAPIPLSRADLTSMTTAASSAGRQRSSRASSRRTSSSMGRSSRIILPSKALIVDQSASPWCRMIGSCENSTLPARPATPRARRYARRANTRSGSRSAGSARRSGNGIRPPT